MPSSDYADWKAPKADEALLVWPPPADLPALISSQLRSLSTQPAFLAGVALSEVRHSARAFLGHTDNAPLIATGHQTGLHHPGVWIKNVIIHHLALATSGRAVHLAVDTDQPKHLFLRFPTSLDGSTPPVSLPLTDDPDLTSAPWTGRLSAPSPAHATQLQRRFTSAAATYPFTPLASRFLSTLRRSSLEEGVLPPVFVSALHELDWHLGLRYDALLASPLWEYEGFLLLCVELMTRAPEYAKHYNQALAQYRRFEGITTPGRPMPDLGTTPDSVELPLWLDDHSLGHRSRLTVYRTPEGWSLTVAGESFTPRPLGGYETATDLRAFLRRHNRRLAPRALTLTTFMRLVVADVFVHGIGGGRYDQVTDLTLASFFQVQPPKFIVATGTLLFPGAARRTRSCVECVRQEGHRLNHNFLGPAKKRHLDAIAAAPRHSPARTAAFLLMHSELDVARQRAPSLADWASRLSQATLDAELDAVLFDRELFYALQPESRLHAWMESLSALLRT